MKVHQTSFGNNKEILKHPSHHVGIATMVSDEGIEFDESRKKIVPAGSLLNEAGVIVNDDTVAGVLLTDTDVTFGDAPGTIVIHGFINKEKIPVQPSAAALTKLKQVEFL